MKLILASQKNKYDHAVSSLQSGSFLQSWDWGEWQAVLGRPVHRFFIQNKSAESMGVIQLVKMTLPLGKYYLYAPYGPVVDLEFNTQDLSELTAEIQKRFPEAVFVRIEPKQLLALGFKLPIMVKTKNIQPGKTLIVDLSLGEDLLLSGMHPKTRYNIRLAQKHGVRVEKDLVVTPGHGLYFQEAVGLLVATAARQGYKGHSKKYYESLVDFFAKKNQPVGGVSLSVYKALYQNRLLASAIMLDFGFTRTYLFGGSSEEDKQVMAPYALHWQAMLDAKAAGLKFYDFWGLETASGKTQGFARFKQGFGGQTVNYSGAYDARFSKVGYGAYCLARFAGKILGR